MHQLCLARNVHLGAEISLGGVQTIATYGTTHGTLGVYMHLALHLLSAQCAVVYGCAVLGVRATVATVDGIVKLHSSSFYVLPFISRCKVTTTF